MTDNTFDTTLDAFGWFGLSFALVGLIVSALTLAYYTGYKRGGGEWRGKDLFGPRQILRSPDEAIVDELRKSQAMVGSLREEISRNTKTYNARMKSEAVRNEKLLAEKKELANELKALTEPKPTRTRRTKTTA